MERRDYAEKDMKPMEKFWNKFGGVYDRLNFVDSNTSFLTGNPLQRTTELMAGMDYSTVFSSMAVNATLTYVLNGKIISGWEKFQDKLGKVGISKGASDAIVLGSLPLISKAGTYIVLGESIEKSGYALAAQASIATVGLGASWAYPKIGETVRSFRDTVRESVGVKGENHNPFEFASKQISKHPYFYSALTWTLFTANLVGMGGYLAANALSEGNKEINFPEERVELKENLEHRVIE